VRIDSDMDRTVSIKIGMDHGPESSTLGTVFVRAINDIVDVASAAAPDVTADELSLRGQSRANGISRWRSTICTSL